MNIKELFQLIYKNELVLPDFQRNFVWNKAGQKALAASVLLNLPIGSFLILEGHKDDFATKKLGYSTKEATPTNECKFLLDGQQRLTSLISIFGNMFDGNDWQDVLRGIYHSLKNKWYIRVVPKKGEEDIFGWNDLIFNEEHLKNIEPSQIEDMIVDKNITINKNNNWWNPNYSTIDNQGNKITKKDGKKYNLRICKEMAKEGLIPLSVYNDSDKQLLNIALDYISKMRADDLKCELENDLNRANKLLTKACIDTIWDEVTKENLDEMVNELRSKWKVNVGVYLNGILDRTKTEIISLKSSEIGRAVIIFERINKGGTKLDNFDLVVARAARDRSEESLTKRIIEYFDSDFILSDSLCKGIKGDTPKKINLKCMDIVKNNEINTVIKNQYLNLLSFLSYVEYGNVEEIKIDYTKKEKILNISYQDINSLTPMVLKGLSRAIAFLLIRCGITQISELHYKLMILPIAYLLLDDEIWNNDESLDKIEYWYWGSIFSGEYMLYPNLVCIDDVRDLYNWIKNNKKINKYEKFEQNIFNVPKYSDLKTLMKEEQIETPVAIQKGLLQYILSRQPVDLYYKKTKISSWDVAMEQEFLSENGESIKYQIQDHHIIPLATATNLQESTRKVRENKGHLLNSILNRTYILSKTNNIISSNAPSKYLKIFEGKDTYMLNSHFIPEDYELYLNSESLNSEEEIKKFYKRRFEKIKFCVGSELEALKH